MEKITKSLINYVNIINGCSNRFKEIHWKDNDAQIHQATDNLSSDILELTDTIIEQYCAIDSREELPEGFFQPRFYLTSYNETVDKLKMSTGKMIKLIEFVHNTDFSGIKSELESFISKTLINVYRSELE